MKAWIAGATLAGMVLFPHAADAASTRCDIGHNNSVSGSLTCIAVDESGHEVRGTCAYAATAYPGVPATAVVTGTAVANDAHPVASTRIHCALYFPHVGVIAEGDSGHVPGRVAATQGVGTSNDFTLFALCVTSEARYADGHTITASTFCV